jgi:hypothetical protein
MGLAAVIKKGGHVSLYNHNGQGWTTRWRRLAEALAALSCRPAVIDAEPGSSALPLTAVV